MKRRSTNIAQSDASYSVLRTKVCTECPGRQDSLGQRTAYKVGSVFRK